MKILESILHFFLPRHSNNHKAKAIHASTLSIYIGLLIIFQVILTGITRFQPQILGYASNITVSDLFSVTNEKRTAAGAGTVQLDNQLSAAASAKGADMFANQYWAHTSPAGRDPWSFIIAAGYNYLFAGENLARDFGDSRSVVDAWMNSPTHRENLLNSRYKDVGFAVVNGKYGNHETTLVVQEFGTKPGGTPSVEAPLVSPKPSEGGTPSAGEILSVAPPKLNPFSITKNVSVGLVVMLMMVLGVDGILVYRRRIARLSSHNLAHLLLLLAVLAALNLIGRGVIL